jgi:uncharacterized repeat protein (TIGR01451 family)
MKIKHLATLALAAGFSATSSAALETVFDFTISNTATLTYDVAGTPQDFVDSNTEEFKVDRKVIFSLTSPTTVPTSAINTQQSTAYTLVNNSNAPIQFDLSAVNLASTTAVTIGGVTVTDTTDTDPAYSYYLENGAVAGFDVADTQITGGIIDLLAGDFSAGGTDEATFYVVATPTVGVNNDIYAHNLTVTATESASSASTLNMTNGGSLTAGNAITNDTGVWLPGNTQTVLDTAVGGADRVGAGALQITSAILGITKKAAVVWDPINLLVAPKAIPGAVIEYTITVTNTGSVAATDVAITDTLPGQLDLATALPAAYLVLPGKFQYTLDALDISSDGGFSANTTTGAVAFPAQDVDEADGVSPSFIVTIAATLK